MNVHLAESATDANMPQKLREAMEAVRNESMKRFNPAGRKLPRQQH